MNLISSVFRHRFQHSILYQPSDLLSYRVRYDVIYQVLQPAALSPSHRPCS